MSLHTTEEVPLATGHANTGRGGEKRTAEVRETVLVVEDDPSHRELLVEMLTLWGYDPVPVGSAEEAEYIAMKKLREKFPDLVLIGVSAMSDAQMARKCKALGADLFIGKPVSMEDLANAL